jgi:hypothetical protein
MSKKNNKTMPKWWKSYWISWLAFVTIIPVLRLISGADEFDKLILGTVFSYSLLGFAYYVRVRPLPLWLNKILYRCFLGIIFGGIIWLIMYATGFVRRLDAIGLDYVTVVVFTLGVSFAIGVLLAELVGKYSNYRGPEQYSPL